MYKLVKDAEQEAVDDGGLPEHTLTVIGGAAFMLYAYTLNGNDMDKMNRSLVGFESTSDIDIALWYHKELDRKRFLASNKKIKDKIVHVFNEKKQVIQGWIDRFIPYHEPMERFDLEITIEPIQERFAHKTTTVHVAFKINGDNYKILDIALKNALYSQMRKKNFSPITNGMRVQNDPVYMNKTDTLTTLLRIDSSNNMSVSVRVPTIFAFVEQQLFVYGNKFLSGKSKKDKEEVYLKRIRYFLPFASPEVKQLILLRALELSTAKHRQNHPVVQALTVQPQMYPHQMYQQQMYQQQMYPYQMYPYQMYPQQMPQRPNSQTLTKKRGGRTIKHKKNKRNTKKRATR